MRELPEFFSCGSEENRTFFLCSCAIFRKTLARAGVFCYNKDENLLRALFLFGRERTETT